MEGLIIVPFIVLFFVFRWRNKSIEIDTYGELIERRETENILLQKAEDNRIQTWVDTEAYRLFNEWLDAPVVILQDKEFKNYLLVVPRMTMYHIHHIPTAKYDDISVHSLIVEKYNKLKKESQ